MFEWSVKRRTGQLVLDLYLSAAAMVQDFLERDEARRLTLRDLVRLRWQRFGFRNASVASAESALAAAILLDRHCARKDVLEAYWLSTEASLFFADDNYPLQQARCEYQRGIAQMHLCDVSSALRHFEIAEKLFDNVHPLSRERFYNLDRLASALEVQGRLVEAEKTRNLANELNGILLRLTVRQRY